MPLEGYHHQSDGESQRRNSLGHVKHDVPLTYQEEKMRREVIRLELRERTGWSDVCANSSCGCGAENGTYNLALRDPAFHC